MIFEKEKRILTELGKLYTLLHQYGTNLVNRTIRQRITTNERHLKGSMDVFSKLVKFPTTALRAVDNKLESTSVTKPIANKWLSLSNINNGHIRIQENIEKMLPFFNESAEDVIFGAIKGVMMIQETYDLKIREFASGNFANDNQMISRSINKLDQLDTFDLTEIAKVAFQMGWYDTALKYLKESISSLKSTHLNLKINIPLGFNRNLQRMRKKFVEFHNTSLMNKRKRIGEDWKLFPYLIDNGLLANTFSVTSICYIAYRF